MMIGKVWFFPVYFLMDGCTRRRNILGCKSEWVNLINLSWSGFDLRALDRDAVTTSFRSALLYGIFSVNFVMIGF